MISVLILVLGERDGSPGPRRRQTAMQNSIKKKRSLRCVVPSSPSAPSARQKTEKQLWQALADLHPLVVPLKSESTKTKITRQSAGIHLTLWATRVQYTAHPKAFCLRKLKSSIYTSEDDPFGGSFSFFPPDIYTTVTHTHALEANVYTWISPFDLFLPSRPPYICSYGIIFCVPLNLILRAIYYLCQITVKHFSYSVIGHIF